MKKRNFVAILMVAIGLFASVSLFALTNSGPVTGNGNGGTVSSNDVSGCYVPD